MAANKRTQTGPGGTQGFKSELRRTRDFLSWQNYPEGTRMQGRGAEENRRGERVLSENKWRLRVWFTVGAVHGAQPR